MFPFLASAYALFFAHRKLNDFFNFVYGQIQRGDFSQLADVSLKTIYVRKSKPCSSGYWKYIKLIVKPIKGVKIFSTLQK